MRDTYDAVYTRWLNDQRRGENSARKDRRRGFFQSCDGGQALTQDALGQDSPRYHQKNCRWVDYQVPPNIDDPLILDEITANLSALGYPDGARTSA